VAFFYFERFGPANGKPLSLIKKIGSGENLPVRPPKVKKMTLPENAIPSGSQPVDQPVIQTPEAIPGQSAKQAIEETAKQNLILGKFQKAEDLVPAYQELEKDHGRLGNEVGNLRKQNEMLVNLINKVAQPGAGQPQAQQEPATDFDKLLADTAGAVEAGDLSVGEGLKRVSQLTAQKMAVMAKETYAQLDSDRNAKDYLNKFNQDNPDFQEALQSGELQAIRAQNPMHDNLSAYYEWKSAKTQTEAAQQVKDAFEKGRNETAALAAGADATKRVLGKSGSEARMTNTNTTFTPVTEAGKITGMMDALKAARAG
jgi:hypothetical protein